MRKKLLGAFTVAFAVLWFLPVVWMLITSLKYETDIFQLPPIWIPSRITLDHYKVVMERSHILRWFLNSVVITTCVTFLVLIVDSLAAFAFARLRFFGRDVLFSIVLASMMVPGQVTIVPLFALFSDLGLINTAQAVILPPLAGAFGVFLLRQFFLGIPIELEESAIIDGCSKLGVLRHVILPLSKPGLSALAIFTALGSWNNYLWPLIVLQDQTKMTLPVGLATLRGTYATSSYGVLMAAAVISSVPIFVMFVFMKKYFIQGIALTGGMK